MKSLSTTQHFVPILLNYFWISSMDAKHSLVIRYNIHRETKNMYVAWKEEKIISMNCLAKLFFTVNIR